MARIDLTVLELAELRTLAKDVQAQIRRKKAAEKRATLRELRRVARERGFTLDELVAADTGAPARFRDPNNSKNTWSGKGPRPQWVQQALAGGKTLDDLRV